MAAPRYVLRAWLDGAFELIVSDELLAETERALSYPKLRKRVEPSEAIEFIELLRRGAVDRRRSEQPAERAVARPRRRLPDRPRGKPASDDRLG